MEHESLLIKVKDDFVESTRKTVYQSLLTMIEECYACDNTNCKEQYYSTTYTFELAPNWSKCPYKLVCEIVPNDYNGDACFNLKIAKVDDMPDYECAMMPIDTEFDDVIDTEFIAPTLEETQHISNVYVFIYERYINSIY